MRMTSRASVTGSLPDREMTFTEDDHYATVNWVSVLEQLSCFISANKS